MRPIGPFGRFGKQSAGAAQRLVHNVEQRTELCRVSVILAYEPRSPSSAQATCTPATAVIHCVQRAAEN